MVSAVEKRLREGLLTTSDDCLSHERESIALTKRANFKVMEKTLFT